MIPPLTNALRILLLKSNESCIGLRQLECLLGRKSVLTNQHSLRRLRFKNQQLFNQAYHILSARTCSTRTIPLNSKAKHEGIALNTKRFQEKKDSGPSSNGLKILAVSLFATTLGVYTLIDKKRIFGSVDAALFGRNVAMYNFIADVVEKVEPAVVYVEVKGRHPSSGRRVTLANGSGFLVRSNGLILTNSHVVEKASRVNVKLYDGSSFEGIVAAVDPVCDMAIIKINAGKRELPVIKLGRASSIRPGEFVAAMGSPLSLHRTTTVGIVSSPLRASTELGLPKSSMEYIQTDAVIGDGLAIGINTLKLTDGICFAIPTDYAKNLLDKADTLMKKAEAQQKPNYMPNGQEAVRKRYMGITMLPMTPSIYMELREKNKEFPHIDSGVYIYKVVVSSPAYAGGLHAGDVITYINGDPVTTATDVYRWVEKSDTLRITVIRGKHYEHFTINTEPV